MVKWSSFVLMITAVAVLVFNQAATATQVQVTITNNAPAGGVHFTPVWVGFHNGSFDSYDGGAASAPELERLAEDGNTGPLSAVFAANGTLAPSAPPVAGQTGLRVQSTVGGAPIGPGQSVSETFVIDASTDNRYFSYVSMVLPSNDYYVANGNALAHDLAGLNQASVGTAVTFNVGLPGTVNDAGTELNLENIGGAGDFEDESVAGLGLLGMDYVGQSVADTGTAENGVNTNVVNAYGQAPSILASHPNLDFNNGGLYPNGIATISISVVPEPASVVMLGLGTVALLGGRRRDSAST